ncbi:MAG: NAD(P)H-hydrate dehydratase [Pseudomonadota bacterium]
MRVKELELDQVVGGSQLPIIAQAMDESQTIENETRDDRPQWLYTGRAVRAMDAWAIANLGVSGLRLMRRAAQACVQTIEDRWPEAHHIAVFCGKGNNAGDGYLIAGILAEAGFSVTAFEVSPPDQLVGDARSAYEFCDQTGCVRTQGYGVSEEHQWFDLVVDALLGTGLNGHLRDDYQAAVDHINALSRPVLAVDLPTGLCADSGRQLGRSVKATVTVTFIGRKRGLFTGDGPDCSGDVIFDDLGVPADVDQHLGEDITRDPGYRVSRLSLSFLMGRFPDRARNSHKYTFGHVLVIGGNEGMSGAILMTAEAALRSGAGLVSVATHPSHASALVTRRPELMCRGIETDADLEPMLDAASVVAIGPGLGKNEWAVQRHTRALDHCRSTGKPMVIDADGLNLLRRHERVEESWILTPHPGEAERLRPGSRQEDRFESVRQIQEQFGGHVLLKGAGTTIYDDDGLALCPYGNPGMSVAGMGDVLTGVIASMCAQGLGSATAIRLGVCLHARAGDVVAQHEGPRGMFATDLLPVLRRLVNHIDVR